MEVAIRFQFTSSYSAVSSVDQAARCSTECARVSQFKQVRPQPVPRKRFATASQSLRACLGMECDICGDHEDMELSRQICKSMPVPARARASPHKILRTLAANEPIRGYRIAEDIQTSRTRYLLAGIKLDSVKRSRSSLPGCHQPHY